MANQNASIDQNARKSLLAVTDDSNAELRRVLVDATTGRLKVSATVSSGVLTSINSDNTPAQTISIGTTGNDIAISDGGSGAHTINIPTASATARGALSSTDWSTFNGKENTGVAAGLVSNHAALLTGVHGLAITAGKVLTVQDNVTITGALGTAAYVAESAYALLAGRSGGQNLYGGTGANDDITIEGTSHATKTTSYVILQPTSGNVGIGTTSPTVALDVNGNIRSNAGTYKATLSSGSGGAYIAFGDASTENSIGKVGGYGSVFNIDTGSIMDTIVLKVNNVEKIRMNSSGNLGIGTTNPLALLSVGATSQFQVNSSGNVTGGTYNGVTLSGNGTIATGAGSYTLTIPATGTAAEGTGTANYAAYWSNANTLTAEQYLNVTRGGTGAGTFSSNYLLKGNGTSAISSSVIYDNGTNVGIGTTSPSAVLHLKAGTATASTAPLKFTSGVVNTTPEAGAMEWDGTDLWITV